MLDSVTQATYEDIKLSIYENFMNQNITESERDSLLEKLNIQRFCEFCSSNGLIPVDDDVITESIASAIGDISRSAADMKEIKSKWEGLADKFKKKWIGKLIDDPIKKKTLYNAYMVLKQDKISFTEYKKNFNMICEYMGLDSSSVTLENVVFSRDEKTGKAKIAVRYAKGNQKIIIPNGTCLLHVSPVPNLKELKPAFKSKTSGKYMYPNPRIFFTLGSVIKPTKAGLEKRTTYKYTPVSDIKTAFIDPSYTDYKTGSIYVETNFPIRVIEYNKKMKDIFGMK